MCIYTFNPHLDTYINATRSFGGKYMEVQADIPTKDHFGLPPPPK